jgi:phosphoglycolate phosphatase
LSQQGKQSMECNLCGSQSFRDRKSRARIVCMRCGSDERTRVMHLFFTRFSIVRPGMRVMHIAPERGLYSFLSTIPNIDLEAFDLHPENFPFAPVRKIDLVTDLLSWPSRIYDVIIHSHVMEHVPCNVTAVLFHLNRMLKDGGEQACVIPFVPGHYGEDFGPMGRAERIKRFGQDDHVRRFGAEDIAVTIGMLFRIPETYDLETVFDAVDLDRFNIPFYCRKGFTPHTFLRLRRSDMLLAET